MNFLNLKKEYQKNKSIVWFDNFFDSKKRFIFTKFLVVGMLVSISLFLYKSGFLTDLKENILNQKTTFNFSLLGDYLKKDFWLKKIFLFCLSFYILIKMFRAFLFSKIFSDKSEDFELSKILSFLKKGDITEALFKSQFGKELSLRLLLEKKDIQDFLVKKNKFIFDDQYEFSFNEIEKERLEKKITIVDFLSELYDNDQDFKKFLLKRNIKKEDFVGAVS